MKINILTTILILLFSGCSASVEEEPAPENCHLFDGNERGCVKNGCHVYRGPKYCLRKDQCYEDTTHSSSTCVHLKNPEDGDILIYTAFESPDHDFAIAGGIQRSESEPWTNCQKPRTGNCACFAPTDPPRIEGPCE